MIPVLYLVRFVSMSILKVAITQFNIAWKDKQANFTKIEELLAGKQADLVVLPEMFQTGFCTDDPTIAETMEGKSIVWMQEFSKQMDAAVCGSLVIKEEGAIYNRLIMASKGEVVGHYDKTHLFGMGAEPEHIAPGSSKVDMVVQDFKIRTTVCYDLRFPYTSFNDSEYDILLNVANWPSARIAHWDALLQARAIENQAFVIACNRVGEQVYTEDKKSHYPGHSGVYGPDGERLVHSVKEEVLTLTITQEVIATTRKQLPFLTDRRM